MSLLNLAFQNTALAREQASADVETTIRSCSSMKEIRKTPERNHRIKDEWLQSVQPIIGILTSRATRVQLKCEHCQVFKAASDDEVEMAEAEVTLIGPTIQSRHFQQQHLVRSQQLKKFIADHCLERHYSFQIRRCKDINCCSQTEKVWGWLSDPVEDGKNYKKFEDLWGHVTDEKDLPSSRGQTTVAQELQGCKNSVLVAQNVMSTVTCTECMKPRCIYAKSKLLVTTREEKHTLENIDYTCGSLITPNGDILQGKVFVRLQMSFQSPITNFPHLVG